MRTFILFLVVCVANAMWAQPAATITGKLLGFDGRTMQQTDIHVYRGGGQRAAETVHAGSDGSYSLTVKDTGVVTVKFAGLFHLSEDIPFLLETGTSLNVDVRLGTYRFIKEPKVMRMMGTFNMWGQSEAKEMNREADGSFSAEIVTKEEKVGYQVIGAESIGRTINGTQSEYFEYDGDGDYRSFVTAKGGKVRIVYDPRLVLISENPPQVTFADPVSRAARYTMIRWRMTQQTRNWSAAYRAFIDAGGEAKDFKYQKDRKAELAEVAAQLGKEEDPLIRPWLLLSYFTDGSGEGDPEIAKLFFREFPGIVKRFPANQVYQLFSPLVSAGQLTGFGSGFKDALLGAVDEVEDINTKGNMFYNILTQIQSKKNDAVMQEYLELALERLANNPWLNMIKSRFAVKKVLGAGKEIPAFRVRSLQDTTLIISSQIMKGKVYLIDFWATWSSTCIRNMESMQRVYEKFKTRGFEIVSLSLDAKADDVRAFRGGQWKMPWLHALVTTNTGLLADFSVSVLPKQYLVDGAGKILATPKDLEEKPLERMLEHVFGAVR